jgi:hypothetical protein
MPQVAQEKTPPALCRTQTLAKRCPDGLAAIGASKKNIDQTGRKDNCNRNLALDRPGGSR